MTVDDWHAALLADANVLVAVSLCVGAVVCLVLGVIVAKQVF